MKNAVSAIVALFAFTVGLRKLDDFDTWWHLAAGRWIAAHHAIPSTDTLSHTVRDHAWVNLQWGFDLFAYVLHSIGGPALLSIAGAVMFLATIVLLMHLLSARIGAGLAALFMVVVIVAAQERVNMRPELLSFLLLAAVLFVLDRGRNADERWLVALVPLMIVWVNVHALFVLGAFAIVTAFIGNVTRPSRRLLMYGGAALVSVLINPYLIVGVLFPLKLVSRIDGSNGVFQAIGEFASPFAADAGGIAVILFKIVLALGVALALWAMLIRRRQFDWGGLIFFLGLAALASSARRNIAIFAIGAAPFIASCLQVVLSARPKWQATIARRSNAAAVTAIVAAALMGAAVVTGAFYKFEEAPKEFGAGVIEGTFPERAAAFARAAKLPGKLYNDMASGGYLAWDDPIGDGVFVDGRLEVYDTAFLTDFATAKSFPARWQSDADRYGIQTAIIFHQFEPDAVLAARLATDDAWSLVYVDEVAAVFVRKQGNDAAIARAAAIRSDWDARTNAWLSRPARRWPYPAGRIEGTRAYGRFLGRIGRTEDAVAAYLRLVDLNISTGEEVDRRLLIARYYASTGRLSEASEQARRILAIDPSNADAQSLLFR
jgi:tetratricopeptide (TPR) repeat protein